MRSGFNRTLTWTWFNMPERIQGYGASAYFTYDADHNRITQQYSSGGSLVVTTYVGGFFERVDKDSEIEDRHYISAPTGRIAIYASHQNKQTYAITYDTKYCHRDHLGSVDVITDANGNVLERDSFDAWGFRRTTDWQAQQPIGSTSIVSRGFTDHEQLDTLGLVHMNGRVYDPGIGRFLSADPFVQAPMVTQNFNRYSYVVNNPLSFTDPSGFNIFGDFFNWLSHALGPTGAQILIGVAAVAAILTFQYEVMPAFCTAFSITGLSATVVTAAGAGFAGAFTSTILSGASLGQALEAGLITGAAAALTAGVIGPMLHGIDSSTPLGFLEKCTAHGITGGVLNGVSQKLENGSFRDGFLAGFASEAASPLVDKIPGTGQTAIAERTVLSATVGGTAAELGGGKFANGAVTAAFLRLYNDERVYLEEQRVLKSRIVAMDYDGDSHAYAPRGSGLVGDDYLGNAMRKNGSLSSDVLVFDENGHPVISADGYYVSKTSLRYTSGYVDGTRIPYIALGDAQQSYLGAHLGDYILLRNETTGRYALAVYADYRGTNNFGIEISPAAGRSLGIGFSRAAGVFTSQVVTAERLPFIY
jgi:RHS repeat-associated protein